MNTDTIAAIATAMNHSGIGIIRVSGDFSIDIVDKIFVNKKKTMRGEGDILPIFCPIR